ATFHTKNRFSAHTCCLRQVSMQSSQRFIGRFHRLYRSGIDAVPALHNGRDFRQRTAADRHARQRIQEASSFRALGKKFSVGLTPEYEIAVLGNGGLPTFANWVARPQQTCLSHAAESLLQKLAVFQSRAQIVLEVLARQDSPPEFWMKLPASADHE